MSEGQPTNLYTALLAAQQAMGPVKKDASNPAFRTKYATLQSVLETIDGPLNDNGLVLLQRFDVGEGVPVLITEIVHAASGDRIASAVPVVSKDPTDPQKMGGAITYYRRYSLLALLGLAPEDDDGHSAAQPARQQVREIKTLEAVEHMSLEKVEREIAPLEKQVRRNDDALSNDEYARYNALAARRKALLAAQPRPASAAVLPASPNQRANQQREIDAEPYDEKYSWTEFWAWAKKSGYQDRHACAVALGKTDDVVNGWTPAQIRTALEVAHQHAG